MKRGRLELYQAGVGEIPYAAERFDRAPAAQTIYFWPDAAAERLLEEVGFCEVAVERDGTHVFAVGRKS